LEVHAWRDGARALGGDRAGGVGLGL
jgi:hypothetical protein